MMTAGPNDEDVMSVGDWVALLQFAEHTADWPPAALRMLSIDSRKVSLENLADELDDLWDLDPPVEIREIIAGVLERLQWAGAKLSYREPET